MPSLSVATFPLPAAARVPDRAVRMYLFFSITRTQVAGVDLLHGTAPAIVPLTFSRLFGPAGPLHPLSGDYDALAFVGETQAPLASDKFQDLQLRVHYYGDPPHVPERRGVIWVDADRKVVPETHHIPPYIDPEYLNCLALTPKQALRRRAEIIDRASCDPMVDRQVVRTMRLFHRVEELTFPDDEVLGNPCAIASLNSVTGYLEERLRRRALCHPRRPLERIPATLEPPSGEDFDFAEDRLRRAFLDVLGCEINSGVLDELVFHFVLGEARPLEYIPEGARRLSDDRLEVMGAPNGAYYLLFAEASLTFLERQYAAADFWHQMARCFAWTIPTFAHVYWDRGQRRMSSYAYSHRRRLSCEERQRFHDHCSAIRPGTDLARLAQLVGGHANVLLSDTFAGNQGRHEESCYPCDRTSPDPDPASTVAQSTTGPSIGAKNFAVRFAHFDDKGKIADGYGKSTYALCAAAIKRNLENMADFKPIGGNTPLVFHRVAVAICQAVWAHLKKHPYPGTGEPPAKIHDELPVPSKLNPKTGGWDPLSRSVFFPVVVPESGGSLGPEMPSFFVGIEILR